MNAMQKVTSAAFLLGVALLVAAAATSTTNNYYVWGNPRILIIVAVATGLTGALLVVVFARGGVVARLQRGAIVLALGASALTMAVAPLNRLVCDPELVAAAKAELARRRAAPTGGTLIEQLRAAGIKPDESVSPEPPVLVELNRRLGIEHKVSVPDWPARSAVAGSELLAGFAIVVVLSLFRRNPRKAGETQDSE